MDPWVAAVYGLSRGAHFLDHPDVKQPFVFVGEVGTGHRGHIVVAREYGDVTWPAYLIRQGELVGDARVWVRQGLADVTDAIARSKERITTGRMFDVRDV